MSTIRKHIWAEVAKLDSNIVDIVLDELVRTATDGGIGTRRCETISHIVEMLSSINVRGRIYSKLRKVRHVDWIAEAISNSMSILRHWVKSPVNHRVRFRNTRTGMKSRRWSILHVLLAVHLPTPNKVICMFQRLSISFRWLLERAIHSSASRFMASSSVYYSLCISLDAMIGRRNLNLCG